MQPWLHTPVRHPPADAAAGRQWVLLTYRLPREPSTPRITVWRKLRELGVAQLGDGLVALPADARTQEQLEWVAAQVREAAGVATLWAAQPLSRGQDRELAAGMAADRAREYAAVQQQAAEAAALSGSQRQRALRSLRSDLRRIRRRDFFPPPERDAATAAVERLAEPPAGAVRQVTPGTPKARPGQGALT